MILLALKAPLPVLAVLLMSRETRAILHRNRTPRQQTLLATRLLPPLRLTNPVTSHLIKLKIHKPHRHHMISRLRTVPLRRKTQLVIRTIERKGRKLNIKLHLKHPERDVVLATKEMQSRTAIRRKMKGKTLSLRNHLTRMSHGDPMTQTSN